MNTTEEQPGVGQSQPALRSPHMERVAKALAARHGIDWSRRGTFLTLAMPGRPDCWLLINLDGARFSVTGCLVEQDTTLTPEVDMVFTLHPDGWEPIELLYGAEVFATYQQAARVAGLPVYDAEGNLRFDTFTEHFAHQLEAQGWLEQSQWVSDQIAPAERETQTAPTLSHHTLQLVCDCLEQCGTVLSLTHDGFLILEDTDGLQVSFMLPDWLDFALRRALLANTTAADDEASTQAKSTELSRVEDDVPF